LHKIHPHPHVKHTHTHTHTHTHQHAYTHINRLFGGYTCIKKPLLWTCKGASKLSEQGENDSSSTDRLVPVVHMACVMSHVCLSHVTHVHESCDIYACKNSSLSLGRLAPVVHMACVMSHVCLSHVTHVHESCDIYACKNSSLSLGRLAPVTHIYESCLTYA